MRKHIVAGNWKMNLAYDEAEELLNGITEQLAEEELDENTMMVICPSFPYLEMAVDYSRVDDEDEDSEEMYYMIGAQDVSANDNGAYTGEVSAEMLESMDMDFCIVGHSERRAYHGETDQIVAAKVNKLLEHYISPIVCCGEVLAEREAGKQFDVVKKQITDGLFHLNANEFANIVIAYEPVWAIGTGKTATPAQAQEMHAFIRSLIAEKYGKEVADNTSILYGGSCKPSNAKELFANPDVDGGLIGGASLKAADFMAIAKAF